MIGLQQQQLPEDLSLDDITTEEMSSSSSAFNASNRNFDFDFDLDFDLSFHCEDLGDLLRPAVEAESSSDEETSLRSTYSLQDNNNKFSFSIEPRKKQQQATSTSTSRQKKVKFSTVEIRSYAITIGDHDCEEGPPMALDWMFNPESTIENVEGEDDVYSRHSPARKLTSFERSIRLAEVADIVLVSGTNLSKESIDALPSVEEEIDIEELFRYRRPRAVVSHAA